MNYVKFYKRLKKTVIKTVPNKSLTDKLKTYISLENLKKDNNKRRN